MDDFPRRRDLNRMHPLEVKFRELILEVEKLGASERLTDCVVLLGEAGEALADHIECVPRKPDQWKRDMRAGCLSMCDGDVERAEKAWQWLIKEGVR